MQAAEATITKWGNGRGILIPKEMCDRAGASIGDKVLLRFDEASRTIRVEPKNVWTLHALMDGYDGPLPGEIDAPETSAGGELW